MFDKATAPHAPRLRATRQGAAIDQALASAERFTTAHELHDDIARRGARVGMATVYRQLKLLVESGVLDVVTRPDGEAAYRLCGPASAANASPHHHHLVCTTCGYTVEIEGPEVEAWAERVAAESGFHDVMHTVEIFGTCGRHRRTRRSVRPRA